MRATLWLVLALLLAAATSACRHSAAGRAPAGSKISVLVLVDAASAQEGDPEIAREREAVGAWMQKNLVDQLKRAGYEPRAISGRGEFAAAPDRYLLSVAITAFRPVSGAARFWGGRLAGATTLNTHAELFGQDEAPVLAMDFDVGSTSMNDSNKCAEELNRRTVKAVSDALAGRPRAQPQPGEAAQPVAASAPEPAQPADDGVPYSGHGFTFRHDSSLTPEVTTADGGVTVSLVGNPNLTLMAQVLNSDKLRGDQFADSVMEGIRKGMASSGARVTRPQRVKARIGDKDRTGKAFNYTLQGVEMHYEAYGWDFVKRGSPRRPVAVYVQYPPAEKAALQPVIETTLRSLTYEPAD